MVFDMWVRKIEINQHVKPEGKSTFSADAKETEADRCGLGLSEKKILIENYKMIQKKMHLKFLLNSEIMAF